MEKNKLHAAPEPGQELGLESKFGRVSPVVSNPPSFKAYNHKPALPCECPVAEQKYWNV